MDDLREIRTLLAKPDPSPEAVARRRRQLRSSMHRPTPRRRTDSCSAWRWVSFQVSLRASPGAGTGIGT
ncbi:hypothetical protein E1286_10415 [Nonomuraea terrae]|uniref:DUF3040 domain-containing protein n=1 Tax=Nonomuraea terrae TaxID=2530383 RepID=A0A4R4Z648_9ACTN|nr:hypothetical protein [Nonomuraea terrae]TDD51582.1 hypothetical protein E1286_10415 [Nonomuraea terrae]